MTVVPAVCAFVACVMCACVVVDARATTRHEVERNATRSVSIDQILSYFNVESLRNNFKKAGVRTLGDAEHFMQQGDMKRFGFKNNIDRIRARHAVHRALASNVTFANDTGVVESAPWTDSYYQMASTAPRIHSYEDLAAVLGVDNVRDLADRFAMRGVRTGGEPYDLVIGIMSARNEFAVRQLLRTTWAHETTGARVLIRFWIGWEACHVPAHKVRSFECMVKPDTEAPTDAEKREGRTQMFRTTARLLDEAKYYGDIAFLDMQDYYRNLPEKLVRGVEWFGERVKFDWLMKIDVDCFVNMKKLLQFLSRPNWNDVAATKKVWAATLRGPGQVARGGKWAEKKYELNKYPKFANQITLITSALADVIVRNERDLMRYQGEDTSLAIWMLAFDIEKRDVRALNKCNQLACFVGHNKPNQKLVQYYQQYVGALRSTVQQASAGAQVSPEEAYESLEEEIVHAPPLQLSGEPDAVAFCDRSSHLRGWSQRAFLLQDQKMLACLPAKTACTVTKRALMRIRGRSDWRDGDPHNPAKNGLHPLCRRSDDDEQALAKRVLADDTYFRFTVVRHPVERFVSAYFNKARDTNYIRRYAPFRKWAKTRVITINNVLNWVERGLHQRHSEHLDEHFAPQSRCCAMDHLPLDTFHIVHHDRMADEFRQLYDAYFNSTSHVLEPLDRNVARRAERLMLDTIETIHDNVSMHRGDERAPENVLSDEQWRRIEEIYNADYERFGFRRKYG